MPVPLPAVPSSGILPLPAAGRSTVDAPVIAAARDAHAPVAAAGDAIAAGRLVAAADGRARRPTAGRRARCRPERGRARHGALPTARRGVPAALIVGALVAMLGGLLRRRRSSPSARSACSGGTPLSGLFTTTVEPKVTGPRPSRRPRPSVPVGAADRRPHDRVAPTAASEAPVAPKSPRHAARGRRPRRRRRRGAASRPPAEPPTPASTPVPSRSPRRPAPPARETRPTPPGRNRRRRGRSVPCRRRDRRRARSPPPVVAEAPPPAGRTPGARTAAGRGARTMRGWRWCARYVAARNTAHASGIRRVWPGVDDNHLRRVTSSFSAPLTLAGCDIEARDAAHAVGDVSADAAGHDRRLRARARA